MTWDERWRMQQEAQIETMMRRGEPLGAVAAALASPETAERIAVLETATTGQMFALEAARLHVQRAGHDLGLLDGLRSVGSVGSAAFSGVSGISSIHHGKKTEGGGEGYRPTGQPLCCRRSVGAKGRVTSAVGSDTDG